MATYGQNTLEPVGNGQSNPRTDFNPSQWSIGDIFPFLPNLSQISFGKAWENAENLQNFEPGTTYVPEWTTGSRDNTGASWNEQMVPRTEQMLRDAGIDPSSMEGQRWLNSIHGDPRMSTDDAWTRIGELQNELGVRSTMNSYKEKSRPLIDQATGYWKDRAARFGAINKAPGESREGLMKSDTELGGQLAQAESAINAELGRQRQGTSEDMASRGLAASGKAIDRDRLQAQQASYLKGQNVANMGQYASEQEGIANDKLTSLAGVESDLASADLGRVMSAYQGLNQNLKAPAYTEPFNLLSANLGRNDINDAKAMQVITLLVNAMMSAMSQGGDMMSSVMGMVGKGR